MRQAVVAVVVEAVPRTVVAVVVEVVPQAVVVVEDVTSHCARLEVAAVEPEE